MEFASQIIRYQADDPKAIELFVDTFESLLEFGVRPSEVTSWQNDSQWWDVWKFFTGELFMYVIALMVKESRFQMVGALLSRHYLAPAVAQEYGQGNHVTFVVFQPRTYIGTFKVLPKTLQDRATLTHLVKFETLIEVDVLLMLRSIVDPHCARGWSPLLLSFVRYGRPIQMFIRAERLAYFVELGRALGVKEVKELVEKLSQGGIKVGLKDGSISMGSWDRISISTLINQERLGTLP